MAQPVYWRESARGRREAGHDRAGGRRRGSAARGGSADGRSPPLSPGSPIASRRRDPGRRERQQKQQRRGAAAWQGGGWGRRDEGWGAEAQRDREGRGDRGSTGRQANQAGATLINQKRNGE